MKDVKVNYNSDKPAQLQAHAYAQGNEIHIAPGQEKHLPHEAWHVAQQKQGRVKPTLQMKKSNGLQGAPIQRKDDEDKVMNMDNTPFRGDEKKADTVASIADEKAPPVVPSLAWQEEKKEDKSELKLNLSEPSKEEDVVKRRKQSAKESGAIVKEYKTEVLGNYKSGFVKAMRKKMVDIVKDIQEKHGQMEQADNYINGDAGVNAFFSEEAKKATDGGDSEAWDPKDDTPAARHTKLLGVADKILSKKFKATLVSNGRLDAAKLSAVAKKSKTNVDESRARLEKTGADKAVVEMYYNQLAHLHEENDKKNEGSSYFDAESVKEERENSKSAIRDEASSIFQYGYIRQNDVKARHAEQKAVRAELETEERITSTTRRAVEASFMAALNVLVKTISLGIVGVKKNRDKRGYVSGFDFSLDEQGKASKVKLKGKGKGGTFEFTNIYNDYVFARDELKAKWKKRLPMGKFAGSALVLDGFRKFIDAIQSIFSSLSLALTAIGLIPGVAPVVAPVIAFCSSVALAIGAAKAALSLIITLINAIAQIENENPELFAEMSGETGKAGLNTLTDSMGLASAGLWGTYGGHGSGDSLKDRLNFNNSGYEPSKALGSSDWISKNAYSAGAAATSNLVPKVTNAAISATGNLDNNDMTYSQVVNEERRIGKSKNEAKGDLVDKKEEKFIKNSVETTRKKAESGASNLRVALAKFVPPPAKPEHENIPAEKQEAGNRVVEIGTEAKGQAQDTIELLGNLDSNKKE